MSHVGSASTRTTRGARAANMHWVRAEGLGCMVWEVMETTIGVILYRVYIGKCIGSGLRV